MKQRHIAALKAMNAADFGMPLQGRGFIEANSRQFSRCAMLFINRGRADSASICGTDALSFLDGLALKVSSLTEGRR